MSRPRLLALLLLVLGACGPGVPDGGAGTSGADSSGGPTTTGGTTTGDATTVIPTSTGGATLPTTMEATTDVTSDVTGPTGPDPTTDTASDATTELGPCVADPAMGICTAACDALSDCCRCEGVTFVHDPRAPTCELPLRIVTAQCPWHPYAVVADGVELPTTCEDAKGWTIMEHDGDLWIALCDDTCARFLAGEILELEAKMFCEAA